MKAIKIGIGISKKTYNKVLCGLSKNVVSLICLTNVLYITVFSDCVSNYHIFKSVMPIFVLN